jgi:hypothetical protein
MLRHASSAIGSEGIGAAWAAAVAGAGAPDPDCCVETAGAATNAATARATGTEKPATGAVKGDLKSTSNVQLPTTKDSQSQFQ